MSKIRVFIVEDSVLMQKIITDILTTDPDFEVVGRAYDGEEALEMIVDLKPDMLSKYDCVLISTDHSLYDWEFIVEHAQLVVDTRNATAGVTSNRHKIVKA